MDRGTERKIGLRRHGVAFACFAAALSARGASDPAVFDAPPVAFQAALAARPAPAGSPLRLVTVEERMGVARRGDLVRVPLFFAEGECADPDRLTLYAADDPQRRPIPCQADDIRRGAPGGGVARMHLYFLADLDAWGRRQFHLVPGRRPEAPAVKMREAGDDIVFEGGDLAATFRVRGPQAGGIVRLETPFARVAAAEGVLAPRLKLFRQDAKLADVRTSEMLSYAQPGSFEVREIRYASGPVFGKVRVRIGPPGVPDALESTYLVPARGAAITATHRMLPEEAETEEIVSSIWPVFLQGHVRFGDDPGPLQTLKIPAGVRRLTRKVHGFHLEAAVSRPAGFAFLNVPHVAWGDHGVYAKPDGTIEFMGPGGMRRGGASNSGSIRAWWYQARYVLAPSTEMEPLYEVGLAHMQPLTAVVDEPAIGLADFDAQMAALAARFREIQHWGKGWQQEAAMDYLAGDARWTGRVQRVANSAKPPEPGRDDAEVDAWTPAWVKEQGNLPLPRNRPKGADRDVAGRLDPYGLGYGAASIPVFARLSGSERLDRMCRAVGEASKRTSGAVYPEGFPRITAFSNAFNMQIGSALFGIYGGSRTGDDALALFYRDLLRSPGAIAIYGRGLRCYSSDVRTAEVSDLLYQAISDLWIRTIELTCDENLMMHPSVFGRYADAVDVTADLQHRSLAETNRPAGRANFFRTQVHDHRWEGWDAAPHIIVLRHADEEVPVGLTEAVRAVHRRAQGRVNWAELMNYFHPLAMLREVRAGYRPPALPALPADVRARAAAGGGAEVSWRAVAGDVAGYRVYRADEMGAPLTLVNSPWRDDGKGALATGTTYTDAAGSPERFYFVTAVDRKGRESHWFPGEPLPRPGRAGARGPTAGTGR